MCNYLYNINIFKLILFVEADFRIGKRQYILFIYMSMRNWDINENISAITISIFVFTITPYFMWKYLVPQLRNCIIIYCDC